MLVPRLTWIVVEDSKLVTARLKRILERFNTLNIVLTAGEGYHSHTRQYKTYYAYITDHVNMSNITEIIAAEMPKKYRKQKGPKPRGVAGRNEAIKWIVENVEGDGVMYFADDDNTYDLRLFEEVGIELTNTSAVRSLPLTMQIRTTRTVSFFPVGLVGNLGVSSPIVRDGKIVGFFDGWIGNRVFAVDMAGFAVNIATLKKV